MIFHCIIVGQNLIERAGKVGQEPYRERCTDNGKAKFLALRYDDTPPHGLNHEKQAHKKGPRCRAFQGMCIISFKADVK